MATNVLDGIYGFTTTTGTGSYTITSDQPGYRAWSSVADGAVIFVTVRTDSQFEHLLATKGGGATATLARTQIIRNNSGSTTAVNWGAGIKVVVSVVSGEFVAMLNAINIWTAHQLHRGSRVCLSPDDATYWHSDINDQAALVANDLEVLRVTAGTGNQITHTLVDASNVPGPSFRLLRDSASPAVNDFIGEIPFSARNSAATMMNFVRLVGVQRGVTAGAELGELDVRAIGAGSEIDLARFAGDRVSIFPTTQANTRALLVGKSALGAASVGIEALSDGVIKSTVGATNPTAIAINRLSPSGTMRIIDIALDGASQGGVDVTAAGVVSIAGAVMSHPSEWAIGAECPDYELPGYVVCSAGIMLEDASGRHPLVTLSQTAADPRVYGVIAERYAEGDRYLSIEAAGSGMVRVGGSVTNGDLLETSHVPGVARRQHDDIIRASTLGKARTSDPSEDIRLIPCTLMCG